MITNHSQISLAFHYQKVDPEGKRKTSDARKLISLAGVTINHQTKEVSGKDN